MPERDGLFLFGFVDLTITAIDTATNDFTLSAFRCFLGHQPEATNLLLQKRQEVPFLGWFILLAMIFINGRRDSLQFCHRALEDVEKRCSPSWWGTCLICDCFISATHNPHGFSYARICLPVELHREQTNGCLTSNLVEPFLLKQ